MNIIIRIMFDITRELEDEEEHNLRSWQWYHLYVDAKSGFYKKNSNGNDWVITYNGEL